MNNSNNIFLFVVLICLTFANAFLNVPGTPKRRLSTSVFVVKEISSIAELDKTVNTAGDKLVVIDYSTTWCGPCKLVLPKYMELSDRYANVIFLKCIGDASTEASALMKREGVRSVPTFHMWKGNARIDIVNGARIEEVEAAVVSHTKA